MGGKANPTVVGAFIVGAVALIIAAIIVFGKGKLFTETNRLSMYFEGSVNGLNKGAPVKFRGVDIGTVRDVQALYNPKDYTGQIRVVLEVQPGRFSEILDGEIVTATSREPADIDTLIERGLRGQLQLQSFVTGLLYVDINFHPGTNIRMSGIQSEYPEIPTIPTAMEEVVETVRQGMQQLSQLPFQDLLNEVLVTLKRVNEILNAKEMGQALADLGSIIAGVDDGVAALRQRVPKLFDRFEVVETEAASTLETIEATLGDVRQLVQRVDGHIDPLLDNTQKTVTAARSVLWQAQKTLKTLETRASPALGEAEKAFAAAADLAGSDSVLVNDLAHSLEALEEAARSIRLLADYLQRNPEALLRGKGRAGGN